MHKTTKHMKKMVLVSAALIALASCDNSSKSAGEAGDAAAATGAVLTLDPAASTVTWEGAKMTETVHTGGISVTEGSLSVKEGKIEAGSFTLDMNQQTHWPPEKC
jgi:polyisoprenoid-binding protein YceI